MKLVMSFYLLLRRLALPLRLDLDDPFVVPFAAGELLGVLGAPAVVVPFDLNPSAGSRVLGILSADASVVIVADDAAANVSLNLERIYNVWAVVTRLFVIQYIPRPDGTLSENQPMSNGMNFRKAFACCD